MTGDGWEFRYFPDSGVHNLASMAAYLGSSDLAYQIGGRITLGKFLFAARVLDLDKIVVHWVGSDAVDYKPLARDGKAEPWVVHVPHHWGVSEWMVREVLGLGVPCEMVPLPATKIPDSPSALPERFTVLVYMPDVRRGDLYGLDRILQVTRDLPHIPFEMVGLTHGRIADLPKNLRVHGRISDLTGWFQRASVVWRPVRHDGLSQMVLEGLAHGRHVLWSYPFPGCVHVKEADEARDRITTLYEQHENGCLQINWTGVEVMSDQFHPGRLRREILVRLEQILDS